MNGSISNEACAASSTAARLARLVVEIVLVSGISVGCESLTQIAVIMHVVRTSMSAALVQYSLAGW